MFQPLQIRDVELKNRIMMSPMGTVSAAEDGKATGWHTLHYGARALGQVGLIMLEVHAVTQQGKDSGSLGIWSDEHISPLQKVVQTIHDQGSKAGLQLWHVGRKGSLPQETAVSASGLLHRERATSALSLEEIHNLVLAFRDAAVRVSQAGIDVIEFRQTAGIATAAVGLITHGIQAKEILRNGRADLVAVGRALLRNPFWPRQAAEQLGVRIEGPAPYNHFWF
ncbi:MULTISPECIES: hypothetical protein [Paenibacillus]|uniref:oxidoreductase n=1 Tax=Paenibacillus TaxID=44249 RepID=UPI0009B63B57|nr:MULTISPECIES: hypothetical protein [Paenibacillus]MEB4782952.1 hypothetical protein [Paenibacillus jamilae]NMP11423.1 hypothetical protein [Paenibacillus polymyxa]RGL29834.1 hypothetical protein DXC69_24270 [Paenibacillus polymyxa]UQQ37788.1 hypothetical protein LMH85_17775 [Paenibacillus polymyxa]